MKSRMVDPSATVIKAKSNSLKKRFVVDLDPNTFIVNKEEKVVVGGKLIDTILRDARKAAKDKRAELYPASDYENKKGEKKKTRPQLKKNAFLAFIEDNPGVFKWLALMEHETLDRAVRDSEPLTGFETTFGSYDYKQRSVPFLKGCSRAMAMDKVSKLVQGINVGGMFERHDPPERMRVHHDVVTEYQALTNLEDAQGELRGFFIENMDAIEASFREKVRVLKLEYNPDGLVTEVNNPDNQVFGRGDRRGGRPGQGAGGRGRGTPAHGAGGRGRGTPARGRGGGQQFKPPSPPPGASGQTAAPQEERKGDEDSAFTDMD
jgi:hypothetical protein